MKAKIEFEVYEYTSDALLIIKTNNGTEIEFDQEDQVYVLDGVVYVPDYMNFGGNHHLLRTDLTTEWLLKSDFEKIL